jgi:hypothetical protein
MTPPEEIPAAVLLARRVRSIFKTLSCPSALESHQHRDIFPP